MDINSKNFEIWQLTPGSYLLSAHSSRGGPDFKNGLQVEVRPGKKTSVILKETRRDTPPWSAAALDAYELHAKALCACASEECRDAQSMHLEEIDEAHHELTGILYQRLMEIDDMLMACEPQGD